jgi:hypothetical protein
MLVAMRLLSCLHARCRCVAASNVELQALSFKCRLKFAVAAVSPTL